MRVIYCWEGGSLDPHDPTTNPYGALLRIGLERLGVRVHAEPYFRLRFFSLWRHVGARILHLNQLHYYYRHPSVLGRSLKFLRFALWLATARLLRMKIVWTLHNLYPHDSGTPRMDRAVRRLAFINAGAVIVHCRLAEGLFSSEFGRHRNVHVVPHGNYINAYPPAGDRREAKLALGVPADAFLYLYFGNLRSYKGLGDLTSAFRSIEDPSARLIIAGKGWPGQHVSLEEAARADSRLMTILSPYNRPFTAEAICSLFSAAEVAVLPYKQILTSGALMLALSYGLPVVCPRLGCLPEYLAGCEGAVMYDPARPEALSEALRGARRLDLPSASRAARQRAEAYAWEGIANQTLAAYLSA